jgi:octanoyl-[GcvH]:protein N-octanoyltransferase
MHLVRDDSVRGAVMDVALGPALLQQVAHGDSAPTLRLYRCSPTVAFGRLDRLRPGYPAAVTAAGDHGFAPVLRLPGGHAAAYHESSLGIDLVGPAPDAIAAVHDRFRQNARRLARALVGLGIDARIGEVPGEYCPGTYSVNARGEVKLIGTAQRLVRGGWLLGAVIVVRDAARVRAVLTDIYERLGLEWDPRTVGAVEDEVPGIGIEDVERAVVAAYALSTDLVDAELDAETLALARRLAPAHQAEG